MAGSNDLTEYEKEERAVAAHKREMEKIAAQERLAKITADADVAKVRSETRPINIGIFAGLLLALALVGGFTYGCTLPPDPNNPEKDKSQIEQQREQDCIAAGGGWVPEDIVVSGDDGLCVLPPSRES